MDFIPELPEDILRHITGYLPLSSIFIFQQVSHKWRNTWIDASIFDTMMRRAFRITYESGYLQLTSKQRLSVFKNATQIHHAFQQGDYYRTYATVYDRLDGEIMTVNHKKLYCSGRIACYMADGGIKVMVLSTGGGAIYYTPDRSQPRDFWLSSSMLVVVTKRYVRPVLIVNSIVGAVLNITKLEDAS